MAILPAGSSLNFMISASSINVDLIVDDAPWSFVIDEFDRDEYKHEKLKNAQNEDGSRAGFQTNIDGKEIQIESVCAESPARDTRPDDSALDDIMKRWDIKEYRIKGAASSPTAVNTIYNVFLDHRKRLNRFNYYRGRLNQNISVQLLTELQGEDFSYLYNTGLTITGAATDNVSETNCLITAFDPGVLHENTRTGAITTMSWSATIQIRTLNNMSAT